MQQWVRFSAKVAAGFLSAWFLLLPVTANALGLGNIKIESALNQPLNAEIELLSATSDDLKGLEVKLASREAFMRAGVDRSGLLSQIKFNTSKRGGKYYVILTTDQAVREPFLNFLLELNWKNGRMLREYTVLLDPAERKQQQVAQAPETTPPVSAPVPAPAVAAAPMAEAEPVPAPTSPFMQAPEVPSSAPTPAEQAPQPLFPAVPLDQAPQVPVQKEVEAPAPPAPAPEPIAAAPEAIAIPAPAAVPAPEETAEAPAPAEKPEQAFEGQDEGGLFPQIPLQAYSESRETAPAPMPAGEEAAAPEPVATAPVGELDYGITKKGDSLWRIAEKLKPNDQVTVYQVMMALQQSNPNAFIDHNIHRMKVGQVMRIEDPNLLTALSKAQAVQQYQVQTQAWEGYLASVGGNVPRQAIVAGEQTQAPSTPSVTSGELTLATPQSESMAAGTGGNAGTASSSDAALLEQQARQAMQEAKTQRQKNTELTARLSDLEAELKRMENLVTIKDSDLANLQRKLDELNAQRAGSAAPAPTPESATKPEPIATPAPVETPPAEIAQAKPEESVQPPAVEQVPEPAVTQEPQPTVPPVAAPAPLPQPATAPSTGGGIMGMIKGFFGGVMGGLNAMMLIIGGVVFVVILLLVFIILRRRKGVNFQESILTGGGPGGADSVSMDASPSQGSSLMGGESSFLSDFAISGVSAIQAEDSEVDPLTEADVFMAYGRYEAAEERLQEAITQDPKRGELRVKLLELFNTTKNKKAFESAAEDYYAALGGSVAGNPLWQKVITMGRELVPGNPLFTGGVASKAKAEPVSAKSNLSENQDVMDIGLDTGVFNTSDFNSEVFTAPPKKSEPAHTDSGLDFNLDMGQPSDKEEDSGLDFSLDAAPSNAVAKGDELDFNLDTDTDDLSGGLDFNLDSGAELTAETQSPATHDDLDFSLNMTGDEEPTATDIKLGMDSDKSAPDLDFDFGHEPETEPSGMDMNLDASDAINLDTSDGSDEVGTKLDLARAYIDMGDPDGARSILDEVLDEGNDGQKKEAQQLMAQIG